VRKHTRPIVPRVPRNLRRRVDFHGHDLGDAATLDDNDERADAPAMPAPFLASLDVSYDERVMDIGPRYNVGRDYRKSTRAHMSIDGARRRKATSDLPTMRLDVRMVAQVNEQRVLPNIGRDTFELQCLETRPPQQRRMGRGELSEVLREVFVCGWGGRRSGNGGFGY